MLRIPEHVGDAEALNPTPTKRYPVNARVNAVNTMIECAAPIVQAAQPEKILATHEQSSFKMQMIAVAYSGTGLGPDFRTGRQVLFHRHL